MFDVPLVIMMTDDEKTIFGGGESDIRWRRCEALLTRGDAKDILAVGFDMKKAFLSSEFDFMGGTF